MVRTVRATTHYDPKEEEAADTHPSLVGAQHPGATRSESVGGSCPDTLSTEPAEKQEELTRMGQFLHATQDARAMFPAFSHASCTRVPRSITVITPFYRRRN